MTCTLIDNGGPTAIAASHWSVGRVLVESVSKTVADEDGFEVDVRLLVTKDLRCKHWDIVARIRFSCDMELLRCILRVLFKEEGEESVNVLSGSNCVADAATAVGIANIDRLVEENDRSVGVPRIWI